MQRAEEASFDEYRICKSWIVEMKRDPDTSDAWQQRNHG